MNAAATVATNPGRQAWWQYLHGRLMPDYNRRATVYWWTVVVLGLAVLVHSVQHVAGLPPRAWMHLAGGTVLAMLAGLVPVRIPRSTNSFTAGEIFIFLLLLLNGPQAAAIASASEAAVGSYRTSRRWTSRIASPAMAAVAMFSAGSLLHAALDGLKRHGLDSDGLLLAGAVCFALAYFVINTVMVTMVARLKSNEPLRWRSFIDSFGWLGVAYAGNASVASFLYLSFRSSGIVVVVAAVPIIVILLTTGHYFFRREEAEEAVRKAREQQAAQRQMLENARHAGMAEIATNVLHNVGNVLNSVNVSAGMVTSRLRTSRAAGLSRAVQALDARKDDLGAYLTQDEKGKLLPGYLGQLAAALEQEQREMAQELEHLVRNIDHIKDVVATQQTYAGASTVLEPVQLHELVEDALRLDQDGLARGQVTVVREFGKVPVAPLDKARIVQILVNLISNARHAMAASAAASRRMTVRVEASHPGLCVRVTDEGEGILPENLTRIFSHGFTTRADGHGFGLHSCALAAGDMGGTLTARSDGPGRGATFTLALPLNTIPAQ